MVLKYFYFKFVQGQIRCLSTNPKPKNHYTSLGIPSTSTQTEVKAAYYKLSKLYHPDKTRNNPTSSQKFRDITEAYEILGNLKTRKLYDKGLYHFDSAIVGDPTIDKFHKSREMRSRPPPPTGRTPIYDFDEWSRNHYGATFERSQRARKKSDFLHRKKEQELNDIKFERFLFATVCIFVICMFFKSQMSYDDVYVDANRLSLTAEKGRKDENKN
ncbi:hypothetical protein NQ317_018281 [Molorchus minor]|uniref:J domain-containing protein n=1 Tax=Molorchus minor TaxID=1323400 RepID=A0ABQ9K3U3_9CUCU|nr:hypothetical protein NQ317_018281 [Molorchus minor]